MIEFECPSCQTISSVSTSQAGEHIRCRSCGALLEIPEVGDREVGDREVGDREVEDKIEAGEPIGTMIGRREPSELKLEQKTPKDTRVSCSRCGDFMSAADVALGQKAICEKCRDRFGEKEVPFDRDSWDLNGVFRFVLKRYQENSNWLTICAISLLSTVIYAVVWQINTFVAWREMAGFSSPLLGFLAQIFVQAFCFFITLGFMQILYANLLQRDLEVSLLFSQFRRLKQGLFFLLIFYGSFVLLSLPFIAAASATATLQPEILFVVVFGAGTVLVLLLSPLLLAYSVVCSLEFAYNTNATALEACKNGFKIMSGQWFPILGMIMIAGLVSSVGLCFFCIGYHLSCPFAYSLLACMFLSLRNGSGLAPVERDL